MKCRICNAKTIDIATMAQHYRKKHPDRIAKRAPRTSGKADITGHNYCPRCGCKL